MSTRDSDEAREAAYRAVLACAQRSGITKFTVAEVSAESGLSRTTLYRMFPDGRDQQIWDAITWELRQFWAGLAIAVSEYVDLEDRMVAGISLARERIADHALLQSFLVREPQNMLPILELAEARIHSQMCRYFADLIASSPPERLVPDLDLEEAAAYLSMMVLSVITSAGVWNLDDPNALRRLVRTQLLGGIVVQR